jgi:hypothetical protein
MYSINICSSTSAKSRISVLRAAAIAIIEEEEKKQRSVKKNHLVIIAQTKMLKK